MLLHVWREGLKISRKDFLYTASSFLLFLFPYKNFAAISANSASVLTDTDNYLFITKSNYYILIALVFVLLTVSLIALTILIKQKKANKGSEKSGSPLLNNDADSFRQAEAMPFVINDQHSVKEYFEADVFYEMLIKAATDGIAFYDREGNMRYANAAYYSLTGHNKLNSSQATNDDRLHTDDADYENKRKTALLNIGFYETEIRLQHVEGYYVNVSSRSVSVRDEAGQIVGFLTIYRDISKLKKVHEDLVKANAEAESSSRLKTSFLANISHEIRTPLNSVIGFSNLLLSENITRETREEYLEQINFNSEKLLQIIGDIIDLSRLESSQIQITYEETSLHSVVGEVIDEVRQALKRSAKPVSLNLKNGFEESSDLIFADRIWLKRVLTHLMDNAVKFTLDGSIEFSYSRTNEDIVFLIKDTGIGINKENLSKIFEGFNQEISGHHRPFEGLGIGLTLAKEVVERMGGKIFVKSEKGVGSEFSFSIPYRPANSPKPIFKKAETKLLPELTNWSTRKCLLVDDNKDVLIYLNRILLDTGMKVLTARSGLETISIVKAVSDIDIVLLDMQMPEMNGIETAREIKKIRKDLPIIAQTAFVFEDDKDIVLEAGCDACLIKPIRKDNLLSVLASFVK